MRLRLRKIVHRLGLAVPLWLMGCGAAQQAGADLSCSPNADAWYTLELHRQCGERDVADCPEAEVLGNRYEHLAEDECSD